MKNFELARLFDLMADLFEIKEQNPFRIRAYRRAAQNLETLTEDVETLATGPDTVKPLAMQVSALKYLAEARW